MKDTPIFRPMKWVSREEAKRLYPPIPRMTAKERYDLKRRGDAERKQHEAERAITRRLRKRGLLKATGVCQLCGDRGRTIWHHQAYQGEQSPTVEVCYTCHRKLHPRPMPNGKVV